MNPESFRIDRSWSLVCVAWVEEVLSKWICAEGFKMLQTSLICSSSSFWFPLDTAPNNATSNSEPLYLADGEKQKWIH